MTDLVDRLRTAADIWRDNGRDQRHGAFLREAADEIDRLRGELEGKISQSYAAELARQVGELETENERLRWALEEIIQSADLDVATDGVPTSGYHCISTHLIDQARAALVAGHRGDSNA